MSLEMESYCEICGALFEEDCICTLEEIMKHLKILADKRK